VKAAAGVAPKLEFVDEWYSKKIFILDIILILHFIEND
jgi:hypothetical protein